MITIYAKGATVEVIDKPVEAPPPAPAPEPTGKYRYQQPYLFQTVRGKEEPSRLAGGYPLQWETNAPVSVGPTRDYVDILGGWPWDKPGGDWIDADGVRYGTKAWFTFNAQSEGAHAADVTTALQFIRANGRPCAFLLTQTGAPRGLAGKFSATPPTLSVTYADGTTAPLACRITALANSGAYPSTIGAVGGFPVFIEFEPPTADVTRATFSGVVQWTWSGAAPVVSGWVLDPPINKDVVRQGRAASVPLDTGLLTDPSIIGVHRYVDGVALTDFALPGKINTGTEDAFDPAIYGNGPADLSKLPHTAQAASTPAIKGAKWVGADSWSVVPSTHQGAGFEPLAPGVGAIRVRMPKGYDVRDNSALVDGSVVGYSIGPASANAFIYLPEPLWGMRHIFVRYYFRLGSPNGRPYRMPVSRKLQVHSQVGDTPGWTECGGKFGIAPDHSTTYGGVSGTSGGGCGWQLRHGWADVSHDDTGPDLGGWAPSLHTYDFGANNPAGFRYGTADQPKDNRFGQRGGLGGILYEGHWYCMETELLLNTVMPESPGYVADGEYRQWIDGRLALERKGQVFRSLPLYNPGYKANAQRPVRELGVRGLWFNWFHGGKYQNAEDREIYIAQLAWGTEYIGPMRTT